MRAEFYREQHRGFHAEHDLLGDIKWKPVLEKLTIPKDGFSKAEWMKISREQYPANRYNPPKKWGKDLFRARNHRQQCRDCYGRGGSDYGPRRDSVLTGDLRHTHFHSEGKQRQITSQFAECNCREHRRQRSARAG